MTEGVDEKQDRKEKAALVVADQRYAWLLSWL